MVDIEANISLVLDDDASDFVLIVGHPRRGL